MTMKSNLHCHALALGERLIRFLKVCPFIHTFINFSYLFPGNSNYAQDLRSPLANVVANKCPVRKGSSSLVRKLYASDFQSNNEEHLLLVKEMGISIINLPDGRVQLLHSLSNVSLDD